MKKTFIYTAAIASMVLALASCVKEQSEFEAPKGAMKLHVVSEGIETKATQNVTNRIESETIDLSENGISLFFNAVEEDYICNYFTTESIPLTKGSIITTDNFSTERSDDFHIWLTTGGKNTYVESGNTAHESGAGDAIGVLKSDNYWYAMYERGSEAYSNYIHWPDSALDFWCWSGGSKNELGLQISDDGTAMSFTYTDEQDTAKPQKDLLFAYTHSNEPATKGDVDITFHHALAAVQFCVGGLDEGVEITEIKVAGVKNSGACIFNTDGTFTWSQQDGDVIYSTGTLSENNTSEGTKWTAMGVDSTYSTFFFVPQDITEIVIGISVSSTIGTGTSRITKNVTLGSVNAETLSAWKAGKIYRYTISGSGEVKIAISEDLDGVQTIGGNGSEISKKENVIGKNTGTLRSFIRAAVVANWFEANKIVAPWDDELELGPNWVKEGGFYYYTKVVEPGSSTESLFTGSVESTKNSRFPNAKLELFVVMQAVEFDKVSSAWGIDPSTLN